MNLLKITYPKLDPREAVMARADARLELQSKPEMQLCKDGKMRPIRRKLTALGIVRSFWRRVDIKTNEECWNWKNSKKLTKFPYGNVGFNGKLYRTHRVAFAISNKNPGNLLVCHKCDNPSCCNPNHLFLGTHADNRQDCLKKGRLNSERGERRHCAKLNAIKVQTIRDFYKIKKLTMTQLAKKFDVSRISIWNVVTRKSWKHLP